MSDKEFEKMMDDGRKNVEEFKKPKYSDEFQNILFSKPKPDDNDELRMLKMINSNLEKINKKLWVIKFATWFLLVYMFLKFGGFQMSF